MDKKYRFYMEVKTETGWEVVEWVNLTKKDAAKIYELTVKHAIGSVKEFGWEEICDAP